MEKLNKVRIYKNSMFLKGTLVRIINKKGKKTLKIFYDIKCKFKENKPHLEY